MCNFMSFVVTPDNLYSLDNSSSHSDIIEHYKLRDDPAKILKVEITPPVGDIAAPASRWLYRIDQDILPAWHTDAPTTTEKRVRRAVTGWMRARPWWKKTGASIESHKTIRWFKPDGNPDPTWELFTAPTWAAARAAAGAAAGAAARAAAGAAAGAAAWDAARAAARAAARDAAGDAAGDAAWDAAWDAAIQGICSDLLLDQKHRDAVEARIAVWRKGYAVLCDVNGVLYVYAAEVGDAS